MKLLIVFIFILLLSCSYPDIDSVPNFKDLKLSEEELFDLCELSSSDKNEINTCIENKRNNL
jgi:hypothetical protein